MTKEYTIEIELESDVLVGSGEGWGGVIDSDVVFDDYGLPYIPARRLKGCLREAAMEVTEAFMLCSQLVLPPVEMLFGSPGQEKSAPIMISNAYLKDYENICQWLQYIAKEYN